MSSKYTTHDALLCLVLHQQSRLNDPSLANLMMGREQMEVLAISRAMNYDGIKVTPESVSLHPSGGEKLATVVAALLQRDPPDAPMHMLVESIKKENLRDGVITLCRKFHDEASEPECNPEEVLMDLHSNVTNLTARRSDTSFEAGSSMVGLDKRIEWRQNNPGKLRGRSLGQGFRRLDERLNGLTPRYYIIGARPSVGKSAMAANWLEGICMDAGRCALFTWEMTADDYRERILCSLSKVNLSAYADRPLTIPELRALSAAQRKMKNWDWWINDNPDTSIDDIEAQCMALHSLKALDMIVIDYIQLIRIAAKRMTRHEVVSEISARLRRLQRRLNVPLIALSQLRRVEGRYSKEAERTLAPKPELSDLRESGDLEQDADVVALIHRDPRWEPDKGEVIIGKQRGGSTGEPIAMDFHKEITRFKESVNQ